MKESATTIPGLLRRIKPGNLLSFGPDTPALEMQNLNVLIGPNGVGKSNLIEALALMRATPRTVSNADVRGVIRRGGGASEWIWKGAADQPASVELTINGPAQEPLRHRFSFRDNRGRFQLEEERVENEARFGTYGGKDLPHSYYKFEGAYSTISVIEEGRETARKLDRELVNPELSILAQRRDPERYPEITYLAEMYESWSIYREWSFGRNTIFREPQKADMRNDRLEEDFSNLGLVLNQLSIVPKAKAAILTGLRDLYEGISDFQVSIQGGAVQVFLLEGDFSMPATRLSDGTLRYLCLLAILCDPEPPRLVCLEEPELGLHPDVLPKLADRLVAASDRTQLIVTTHSDILVDALTEHPETVVVCEKHDGRTEMRRQKKEELAAWLEDYRLGQLWMKGQLGGTRW